MDSWGKLSMRDRAGYMKLAIDNGIYDLNTIRDEYNRFAEGGGIHIKPENRGKFTALKERTGHSATWFKEHGTPAQKKMATFALNARHWKHDLGGNLFSGEGTFTQQMNTFNLPVLSINTPTYTTEEGWESMPETLMKEVVVTAPAPYKELPQPRLQDNEYLNNQYEQEVIDRIKGGTKEEIMQLQKGLADAGRFDLNTDNMSDKEIKSLQKKIGAKVDGIWGPESKRKWREYNVDGIFGDRTLEAFNKNKDESAWERSVPTENTEWCAEWVNKKVSDAAGDNYGVWGNAWNMPQNIVDNGGEELYNIYNEFFDGVSDIDDLKHRTERAVKENPFDIKKLRVGDVVGIYMPSSDMHEVALRDGSTFNTHVGVVTGFDSKGTPIIEHNIHKHHHKDRADHLTGSLTGSPKIVTVSRPAYSEYHTPFSTETVQSQYTSEDDSPLFQEFANSVAGSKELLSKMFPNIDADEVERITLAVQGRETGFMKNKASDQHTIKARATRYYRDKIKKKDPETVSSNLAKMKLSSFSDEERNLLGIHSPKDLEDPTLAGRAAAFMLAKNYSYFKDMQETYPNLGIQEDDIRYLTALSYNQGMKKLRNIGFNSKGLPAPEELETIRTLADEDTKIKDISATNYAHLGKVGEIIYDLVGDAHTPYIAAEEKYRKKLIDKANEKKLYAEARAFGGNLFDGLTQPTQFMEEDRFATTNLPEVTIIAPRKYVAGYDDNGNPIYTDNLQESMGYTPYTGERTKYQEWANRDKNAPKYSDAFVKAAQLGIGLPLLATNPTTGGLIADTATDLLSHPIGNAVGFYTGSLGKDVDQAFGITENINRKTNNKLHLPDGTLGELLGYGYGRAVGEVVPSSLMEFANQYIPQKARWYVRAAMDGITNPLGTYNAINEGTYIKDFASLRRNVQAAQKAIREGAKFTDEQYSKLMPDFNFETGDVKLHSWEDFKPGTTGYFSHADNAIHMPVTSSRASNRVDLTHLKRIGAHEEVHANNRALNSMFDTPNLGVYRKNIGILPNNYYVPNPEHPIAKKYGKRFMLTLNPHGRYPEEHFANYMGSQAVGEDSLRYYLDNFNRELSLPPKGFIDDYQNYLSNTYRLVDIFPK